MQNGTPFAEMVPLGFHESQRVFLQVQNGHLCSCKMGLFDNSQTTILQFQNGTFTVAEWIVRFC